MNWVWMLLDEDDDGFVQELKIYRSVWFYLYLPQCKIFSPNKRPDRMVKVKVSELVMGTARDKSENNKKFIQCYNLTKFHF